MFIYWALSGDKVGVAGLVRELQTLPKDPTDPNSYSVIISELGNNYTDIARAVHLLEAEGGFDFVLPEQLMERLVHTTGSKQGCPLPTLGEATARNMGVSLIVSRTRYLPSSCRRAGGRAGGRVGGLATCCSLRAVCSVRKCSRDTLGDGIRDVVMASCVLSGQSMPS